MEYGLSGLKVVTLRYMNPPFGRRSPGWAFFVPVCNLAIPSVVCSMSLVTQLIWTSWHVSAADNTTPLC